MNFRTYSIRTTGLRRIGLRLFAAAALLLCAVASRPAAAQHSTSYIYVESNIATPGGNSLFGFRRDAHGNLTPLLGSPFSTGGTGVVDPSLSLGPFDSDQEIISDPSGKRLFAVNSGSDTIAVLNVQPDGSLIPVSGSPFDSGGVDPVSVGLAGNVLIAVNKDQDPAQNPAQTIPNYTTFSVGADGSLTPVAGSTIPVALGSSPSQALVSPDHNFVFGADFLGGLLQSFRIRSDGRLAMNTPSAIPDSVYLGTMAPHLPLGLAAHPTLPILYVGLVTISQIGVYTYDVRGRLSFVTTAADSGTAVCWLITNKAGTRLYASNTGDNSISVFDLKDPLFPQEIQHLVLNGSGNGFQIALDPDGKYLYSVSQRASASTPLGQGNYLHVLSVARDGTLTEVASSPTALPVPAGDRPQGVVAVSSGH